FRNLSISKPFGKYRSAISLVRDVFILSFVMNTSFSPDFVLLSNCHMNFSPVVSSHSAYPSDSPSFRMTSGLICLSLSGSDLRTEDFPLLFPPVMMAVQPLKSALSSLIDLRLDTVIFFTLLMSILVKGQFARFTILDVI